MKVLIVVCAVLAVSLAGYAPVPYGGYGGPAPYAAAGPPPIGADFFDAAEVAQQNSIAEAQGAQAAAQGAAAAADGTRSVPGAPGPAPYGAPPAYSAPAPYGAPPAYSAPAPYSPPSSYGYAPAAPVQLTSQGVPVEPLDVQAARAANAAAHHAAKSAALG